MMFMFRRPRRLFARIYLHFLLVLMVVGIVTGAVLLTGWKNAWMRHAAERMTRHAARVVAERFDDPAARDRHLAHLSDELDIDVTVRDAAGKKVVAFGPELAPPEERVARAVGAGRVAFGGRGPGWYIAAPIIDRKTGVQRGVLQASLARRFHSPAPWRPVLIVVGVLGLVALGTAPLARRISRPVEKLTEATRRFGAGDLSARVADCPPPRRFRHHRHLHGDELSELTAAWNEMADRIERLVREHKELLANVSHELRSPLARIRLAVELLPQGGSEARLRDIESDVEELDHLIDDLLTTSRLEARGAPPRRERVVVGDVLRAVVERARRDPLLADRAPSISPDANLDIVLEADGELLRRAVWNLVENAGKYGAPPITLDARATDGGTRVALTVGDEGPGIPEADRERVFQPFFRVDRAHTPRAAGQRSQGFGLGLTLARRIAEAHGGTLQLASGLPLPADDPRAARARKGPGCRVLLDLPLAPPASV